MVKISNHAWVGILCAIAGPLYGQQGNPLIGEWRGVAHDASKVSIAFDVTYFPNNTFVQTLAIPPDSKTGSGSGIIYSKGLYRITSDHTVAFTEQERKACPNGDMSACMPIAVGGMRPISFRLEGADKLVNTETGDAGYRVR